MNRYKVHYINAPNGAIRISREQIVEARSFQEALEPFSNWPIVETYDHASACALNPGTNLYDLEAWEAFPVNAESAS